MATASDFPTWVQNQLDERGWKQADLARKTGLNSGYISQVMNGVRSPGVEFCAALARAFNLRDSDVMKAAGLLSSNTPDDQTPSLRELISRFSQLSDADRVTEIDAKIAQYERQMDSLFERFGSDADGELSARAELKIRELRQAVLDLRSERSAAIDTTESTQRQAEQRATAIDQVKRLARKLDRATFATKRQVIELLDVRVKLGRREDGKRVGWLMCVLLDSPLAVDLD